MAMKLFHFLIGKVIVVVKSKLMLPDATVLDMIVRRIDKSQESGKGKREKV
jgi:hypothetical protein